MGAAVIPILMIASTVVGVVGTVMQGQAQQDAANAQAQQALNDAAYKQEAARVQAENIRRAGRSQVSQANAALAASGVQLGEGTPLEVKRTIVQRSEQDALFSILNGKNIMSSAQQEAAMLGKAGQNAVTSSYIKAGTTVLGSATKMYQGGYLG